MPNKILGMDVSRYQLQPDDIAAGKNIDWEKAWSAGVRWVAIRFTVGDYYKDPCRERFWSGAKAAGMKCAPYFVTMPVNTYRERIRGSEQARWAAQIFEERDLDFPPVLDAEIAGGGAEWTSAVNWEMHEHMVKRFGAAQVYTNAGFGNQYLYNSYWGKTDLFIANWGVEIPLLPNAWKGIKGQPVRWQYTNQGNGYKYGCTSRHVDLDWWLTEWETIEPPPVEPPVVIYPEELTGSISVSLGDKDYTQGLKLKITK
jgi:GH25 family lysozyme M1 (1,4-beta-N-acetylmuramidase)